MSALLAQNIEVLVFQSVQLSLPNVKKTHFPLLKLLFMTPHLALPQNGVKRRFHTYTSRNRTNTAFIVYTLENRHTILSTNIRLRIYAMRTHLTKRGRRRKSNGGLALEILPT